MNRDNVFDMFDGIRSRYIMDAIESRKSVPHTKVRARKYLLIAAVVALALLLMGCVAVFLGLQQRKIGEIPVTQKFDEYGTMVSDPEKTWYIVTMSGYDNSPAQQASQEWNEFVRTYKPAMTTNEPDLANIPNQYEYTYQCWDQTMVDKLNEIAAKYDLELLGTRAVAQSWQREAAFETLGLTHLVWKDVAANVEYGACRVYPPYNFICDVRVTLSEQNAAWTEEAYCEVHYLQSGYLAPNDTILYDPASTQEWEYTTKDGTNVLLALSGTKGTVLAQREDSTIVIQMDLAWQQGVFLDKDMSLPTTKAMEQLADCFDYSIVTQAAPMEGLQEVFDTITDPDAALPDDYEAPRYASFAAFLNEYYLWPELVEFAFHDIDGDGQKDLITSYGDGYCINWLAIRDGQVIDITGGRGAMRLCEGNIVQGWVHGNEYYIYMKVVGTHPEAGTKMELQHSVRFYDGKWEIDQKACTEREAAELMAQYKPLELDWKPLTAFPMDEEGTTFGDILDNEPTLSGEALLDFYRESYDTDRDYWLEEMSWFILRDINGDGTEDLLLSVDGDRIDMAYTYRRGKLVPLDGSFWLCQGDVVHFINETDSYMDGTVRYHGFRKLKGSSQVFQDALRHFVSQELWRDRNNTKISEAEAQAILGQYPHVKLDMKPIDQLFENE